jgi:hypothetical protein
MTQSVQDAAHTIRHVYQDDEGTLGHGRGLREALGWWWYAKTQVFQESLQAVERFAQGILTAKVDGARDAETGLPNTELINQWRDVLEDLRSRHVLRSTIYTLIMGANLTTSANSGGSYALAQIQENSTEALVQYDRETLEDTLTDDLLGCIWWKNHANLQELGISNEKPRFSITQEKREDPQERAAVAQVLAGMGVELSLEDVLEQTGFRKPEPGEEVVRSAPDPASSLFGGLGLGTSQPETAEPEQPTEPVDLQETALNGAQVQAAADIIDRVVNGKMPSGTAIRMLTSMFNLPLDEAQAMVTEAEQFTPTPQAEV